MLTRELRAAFVLVAAALQEHSAANRAAFEDIDSALVIVCLDASPTHWAATQKSWEERSQVQRRFLPGLRLLYTWSARPRLAPWLRGRLAPRPRLSLRVAPRLQPYVGTRLAADAPWLYGWFAPAHRSLLGFVDAPGHAMRARVSQELLHGSAASIGNRWWDKYQASPHVLHLITPI